MLVPVAKAVNFNSDDWSEQLTNQVPIAVEQKKFEPIEKSIEACLARIKRYVQKDLPEQWR